MTIALCEENKEATLGIRPFTISQAPQQATPGCLLTSEVWLMEKSLSSKLIDRHNGLLK
jgi:hypothetical protein